MSSPRKFKSVVSHLKGMIARQTKYIETWSAVLSILESKNPEEAVEETKKIISDKIDTVKVILAENLTELQQLEANNA